MKKILAASVLGLTLTLAACDSGVSGTPMPLTSMGASQFNSALNTFDIEAAMAPAYQYKDDPDKTLEIMIDAYKQAFDHAGYSLEATLAEIGENLVGSREEQEAYFYAHMNGLTLVGSLADMFSKFAKQQDLDLSDYLHPDAVKGAEAMSEFLHKN